jgi:hypothetical protein
MEEFQTIFRDPGRTGQAPPKPISIVRLGAGRKIGSRQEDGCGNKVDYVDRDQGTVDSQQLTVDSGVAPLINSIVHGRRVRHSVARRL